MAGWENTGRYGRWTSHTGERERERDRGKGGSKTGNSRGKKEEGAWKESRKKELPDGLDGIGMELGMETDGVFRSSSAEGREPRREVKDEISRHV